MSAPSLSLRELQTFDPRAPLHDGETRFCCPLCGEGKPRDAAHRSLAVNVRTGKYRCHRCEAEGMLLERQEGQPPLAPRERRRRALTRAFGLPSQEPSPAADPAWRKRLAGLQPLAGTPGAAYLAGRGIPCELAHAAGVRFSPSWYGRPAVVFPFRDSEGLLVAAQGRCLDGKEPGKLSAGPIGAGVFFTAGARELLATAGVQAGPITLTEAPIDALSLVAAGLPALALAGTGSKPWLPRRCAFRWVLLATDADGPGDLAAEKLAGELAPLGAHCERLRPATAKDWNEVLQRSGLEALREALAPVLAGMAAMAVPNASTPEPALQDDHCACGLVASAYGPDGIPYCEAHAPAAEPPPVATVPAPAAR